MRATKPAPFMQQTTTWSKNGCSRQSIRLEGIPHANIVRKPSKNFMKQQPKRIYHSQCGGNSQSDLIRQLNMISLKAENEHINDLSHLRCRSHTHHILQKIGNSQPSQELGSVEGRVNACKSFLIRRKPIITDKNNSASKKNKNEEVKIQHEYRKTANLDQSQPHLQLLYLKSLSPKQNNSINNSNNQKTDKQCKKYQKQLHMNVLNHTAAKVKAVICKKRMKRESADHVQQINEEHRRGSNQKIQQQIQVMIKKVRKHSQTENELNIMLQNDLEHNQRAQIKNNQHFDTLNYPKLLEKDEKEKEKLEKVFNACKTVKITWQPQAEILNKLCSNVGQSLVGAENLVPPDRDDIFGGISLIAPGPSIDSPAQIDSLKELFQELNPINKPMLPH